MNHIHLFIRHIFFTNICHDSNSSCLLVCLFYGLSTIPNFKKILATYDLYCHLSHYCKNASVNKQCLHAQELFLLLVSKPLKPVFVVTAHALVAVPLVMKAFAEIQITNIFWIYTLQSRFFNQSSAFMMAKYAP